MDLPLDAIATRGVTEMLVEDVRTTLIVGRSPSRHELHLENGLLGVEKHEGCLHHVAPADVPPAQNRIARVRLPVQPIDGFGITHGRVATARRGGSTQIPHAEFTLVEDDVWRIKDD